jgi:26S proteasome non-ATPase regulatory subunit 9
LCHLRIAEFGTVNADNFSSVADVAREVSTSLLYCEGSAAAIHVKVVRGEEPKVEVKMIRLVPRDWSGRGMLGCNIVPMPEPAVER